MMPVLSLALFCSLSQSQSQSPFPPPSPSRRCLYLLCYAIPHSQFQTLRISNKPKPPPSNLLENTNLDNPLKIPRWKPKHSESLNHYHSSLPSQNPPPSIQTFKERLSALVFNSDPAVFTLFDRITLTDGIRPDGSTYGVMIKYCARINRLDLAFCFLGMLLKEGHTAKPVIFSPIIKSLCSENRANEAAAVVLYKMPKLGSVPNLFSYNILIKGFCSKGNIGFSLQLLYRMIKQGGKCKPCVITYSVVIDELCKIGQLAKAFGLYRQMCFAGVIPDTITYNSLINGLCKKGEIEKAKELMHDMSSKGYEHNVVTYNTLIDGLCHQGEITKANELLHEMISKGYEPNVVTYNILIDWLCKKGQITKAKELFHEMISKGYMPTLVTYNAFVDWLCKKGEVTKAKELMHDMISKGCKPSVVTYNTLINGLCNKGEITKAKELMYEMISKGYEPDVVTYTTLIVGLYKNGEVTKAKELQHEMISKGYKPNATTYNTTLII
ncbi:uncharacterized protein LOC144548054 [Carex rostrata]